MSTWYTGADAGRSEFVDLWADTEQISDSTIELLLEVARDQVTAYAPALPPDAEIPQRYRLAQLRQAVNLYRAATVDSSGDIGDGTSFAISPRPLDWHIKSLLRPARGRPSVR